MDDMSTGMIGYDVPAAVGMTLDEIATPALVIDLDAFERNLDRMAAFAAKAGVRLRAHAKTHRSADIALIQMARGGACGMCCQTVSEADALVRGGVSDVLVTNEVVDPRMLDRLADLAGKAAVAVCVDDVSVVPLLSAAASRFGSTLTCLVEIDCGGGRCGVGSPEDALAIAKAVAGGPGLMFGGLHAYHGSAQHIRDPQDRKAAIDAAISKAAETVRVLEAAGLVCATVTGAGTGSFPFEAGSGVYTELQCGSYIFMDADYCRVGDATGEGVGGFENALFVFTSVVSVAGAGRAVCNAGLKAHSIDSGLPVVHGRVGLTYRTASDEHGVIDDPDGVLALNDRLLLVPGHCDPTCNLHDWYVGVRDGRVECLWPVTARGKSY
ncbi:MAG: DSD1 family PLP-dependent enzyme [Rhodobiaceae bacterium]|nr:DSD1 family PLP-dependent enzyme [Rhodobiaceae bacterium]